MNAEPFTSGTASNSRVAEVRRVEWQPRVSLKHVKGVSVLYTRLD